VLRAFRTSRLRFSIAALYALAVLFVGLSHRPVVAADVDLSAYAIPGAVGPIFCLGSESDGPIGKAVSKAGPCDACRLTAVPGLAPAPAVDHLIVRFGSYVAPCETPAVAPRDLALHDYQSRAPPGVS